MSAAPARQVPPAPGSGVRAKTFAPPPPRKQKKPSKVDGLRTHRTALEVLRDHVRKPGHRDVVHVLLEDVGFRLPAGCILPGEKTLAKIGLSRRRVREICKLYPDVLRIAFRGPKLHVFSEWGMWNSRERERDRGAAWDKIIAFHRRWGTYAFVEETAEALRRARAGGPKRGLAARVPKGGFGPEQPFLVENLGKEAVESCGEPRGSAPKVRDLALGVRPIPESYPPNSRGAGEPLTDTDLCLSSSSDRQNEKSGLVPLRSLGTRAKPGSEPEGEPSHVHERREGPERISFVFQREKTTGPPPLPEDGHVPSPRATETSDQGAPRAQETPGVRKTLYAPPGRVAWHHVVEAFEREMRRQKPHWRLIRRPECLAHLATVWENWCRGRPLRWLEPWMRAQVEEFVGYDRSDYYQARGFLNHLRVEGIRWVAVPPLEALEAPKPEEPAETLEDVRAALREGGFSPRAISRG